MSRVTISGATRSSDGSAATIASTVARLPMTSVLPFLEAVLQRVQGRPARVASLASWMRALLAQHAAYLMGCPQLLPMLTPLYQLIEERVSACASLPLPFAHWLLELALSQT